MAKYRFKETDAGKGDVRLEWQKAGKPHDPLDFWIVPAHKVDDAKARVRLGEFD